MKFNRSAFFAIVWLCFCGAGERFFAQEVTFTTLANFNGTNGAAPNELVQGKDGYIYGTTASGGATWTNFSLSGYGTVFKVSTNGEITTLASFYRTNGTWPMHGLVQASDGNFYGTTTFGGTITNVVFPGMYPAGFGTVFKVTPQGELTMLISFNGTNGALPWAGLVEGPDGALYGTTRFGGASYGDPRANCSYCSGGVSGFGSIFEVTTNGEFTTVYSFTPDTVGYNPMCALTLGRDGYFYGQTLNAMVFKMTAQGALTPWVFLNSTNSPSHLEPLVQGRDGNLYGVSQPGGGTYHNGAVFSLGPDGTQTTIASLPSMGFPKAAIVEGTDGKWYGGRDENNGSLYQISLNGDYTNLFSFTGTNTLWPDSPMIQGVDGSFYGAGGGGPGQGVIYRLSVPSAAAPRLRSPAISGSSLSLSWSAIPGRSYQVQYKTNLDSSDWTNLGTNIAATNSISLGADSISDTLRLYRVVMLP